MVSSLVFLVSIWGASALVHAATPFTVPWTGKTYGPDGPWQAVQVKIGSDRQEIALYPGGAWQSYILLSSICSNTSLSSYCYANRAGVFNKLTSTTYDDTAIRLTINDGTWGPLHFGAATDNPIYGTAKWALDSIDISGVVAPNVSLNVVDQGYQIYPDGTNYPLELGVLSLGAPSLQQQFANRGQPTINGTFFDSYLYTSGAGQVIPSYSYGMHIGTPTYNLAGSLLLGGYDQSRVLGEVSSQSYSDDGGFPIKLRDISLVVIRGGSPWLSSSSSTNSSSITITNNNPTGLLAAGNSSITANGITVYSSPGDTGNWFLAQAPGPNLQTPSTTVIQPEDTTVVGSDNSWEDSWSGVWTALPIASAAASTLTTNTTTTGTSSCENCTPAALSTGAKVGIGVACGVVSVGATALITLWCFTRRHRRRASFPDGDSAVGGKDWPDSMQGQSRAGYEATCTTTSGGGGGWPAGRSLAKPPVELGAYRNEGLHEMG
ncbi:hypothetical protein BP00DRAFT_480155 [Aspergillus indologenus CBS 114.80]|uniref:Peptidase A1 domain-containing protein n=1 Tax=Aspergillus indologenus CBS 114.80 TaxID=1450541 RepID=A0A2V5I1M4_9EURO|nr:hypothetical protein BP00DRAFT_480155 [Aspergillus indologenus CBS 114.80]